MIYIFTLWLFLLVTYSILDYQYLQDPGFDFDDEHQNTFMAFKFLLIVVLIIGLGWMLNNTIYIFRNFQSRMWRHKMLFVFSIYFIICYFILLFSGSLSVYNDDGSRVLLVFGIINIYVWFLEYFYVPSKAGLKEAKEMEMIENKRPSQIYDVLDESDHDIQVEFHPPEQDNVYHLEDNAAGHNYQVANIYNNNERAQEYNQYGMSNANVAEHRAQQGNLASEESIDHHKGNQEESGNSIQINLGNYDPETDREHEKTHSIKLDEE